MSEPRQTNKDEGTYTQVPNVFFDTCDLPETAQILYLRLYRGIHYKGCKFTGSIRKLSKLVRLSKSTVDRMIKKLKEAHLINVEYSQSDEEIKEIMTITICKEELWTLNRYHHHIQSVPNWDNVMPEMPDNCPNLGHDVPEMGQDNLNLGHRVPDASTKEGTTITNNINNNLTREDGEVNQEPTDETSRNDSPSSQEKSLEEERETKPDQVELFRTTFMALGKEYFQYDKFTANRVQPNSEVYTRIREIIGESEVSPQSMRVAFLKLWDHKDKDGTHWWRDKSKLTLKAYVNNYDDQDTSLQEMDLYARACMQSAARLKASTPGSQYIVNELDEVAEGYIAAVEDDEIAREAIKAYYSQPTIHGMTNFAASTYKQHPVLVSPAARQRNIDRLLEKCKEEDKAKGLITEGPLAGQPDYHADPWA